MAKSAVASLTSRSQRQTAKAATFNQNALSSSLSPLHSQTSKLLNLTLSRNLTVFVITRTAVLSSALELIFSSPTVAMPTWIHTQTCHILTMVRMPTTHLCSAITTLRFKITKFSLWDEENNRKIVLSNRFIAIKFR